MLAINGWDTSASKAILHCASCWWKQRKQPCVVIRIGGVGSYRERRIAKVAMARRLAVRLYWMWRNGWEYAQSVEFGSHAGQLVTGHGVN